MIASLRRLAVLALLLMTACVTEMGGVKPSTQLANVDETTAGYALLSISGPSGTPFITWGLKLRQLQNWGMVDVDYDGRGLSLGTKRDFTEGDTAGAVYLVPLPPGDYAIVDYYFFLQGMPGSYANYRSNGPFALPFRIETGKVTYLGDYVGMPGRRALIGWSSIHGAYWWVRDRQERDTGVARQKWPQKNTNDVVNAMPDLAVTPTPGFSAIRLEP